MPAGTDGVKRTAYQLYTKTEYARMKRQFPSLPKQQLFDRVIQGVRRSRLRSASCAPVISTVLA